MTQEQLDQIKANHQSMLECEAQIKILKEQSSNARKICDHKNPDESSSIKEMFLYDMCDICFRTW